MAIKDLPLVRNKKLKHKICHFVLRLIKELGQIVKNHTMKTCGNTWKLVQFFCLIKSLHQHKWWKLFQQTEIVTFLNHIGMVRRTTILYGCYNVFWPCSEFGVISKKWFVIFNGDKYRAASLTFDLFIRLSGSTIFGFFVDSMLDIYYAFCITTGDAAT